MMKKTVLLWVSSLIIGICVGFGYLRVLPQLPTQLVSPLAEVSGKRPTKIFGFLPYWLLDKADSSYTKTLTTLAYFSLTIAPDGSIQTMTNHSQEDPGWTWLKRQTVVDRLRHARQIGQTTSLVVFSGDRDTLHTLFSDPIPHANALLRDVIPIMQEYQFSDLNLDLEIVGEASQAAQQRVTQFVRTVKEGLIANKAGTLSLDMTVSSLFSEQYMNPAAMASLADTIIIMTYDYHYPGSLLSGAVAPLGGTGTDRIYDVSSSLYKLTQLIPKEKILLGVPLYGYEWETLTDTPGAPVIPGSGQTASDRRVEQLLSTCTNCIQNIDFVSSEPYIIFPENSYYHQIYYTDASSIAKRIDLARSSSIGGVALWALGYEGSQTMKPLEQYKKSLITLGK